jgi:hypothetical protein
LVALAAREEIALLVVFKVLEAGVQEATPVTVGLVEIHLVVMARLEHHQAARLAGVRAQMLVRLAAGAAVSEF